MDVVSDSGQIPALNAHNSELPGLSFEKNIDRFHVQFGLAFYSPKLPTHLTWQLFCMFNVTQEKL